MADSIEAAVQVLSTLLVERQIMLSVAESCTGGMLCAAITGLPGSSQIFDRGFVTYSNKAKQALLNVPEDTLTHYGAVSIETAEAMAVGALACSESDVSVSITGIAGPGGGSVDKPVGLVHFGWAVKNGAFGSRTGHFLGTRKDVRRLAVEEALDLVIWVLHRTESGF